MGLKFNKRASGSGGSSRAVRHRAASGGGRADQIDRRRHKCAGARATSTPRRRGHRKVLCGLGPDWLGHFLSIDIASGTNAHMRQTKKKKNLNETVYDYFYCIGCQRKHCDYLQFFSNTL
jgi:hypothetical protein